MLDPELEQPLFMSLYVFFVAFGCLWWLWNIVSILFQILRSGRRRRGWSVNVTFDEVFPATDLENCTGQLQSIPVSVYSSSPSKEKCCCLICFEEYSHGHPVRVLPSCKHMYHKECIDQWLTVGSSFCPVCRARVIQRQIEPLRILVDDGIV